MLKTKLQTSHLMIRLSVGLLAVFALALICPIVPGDSHAEGEVVHDVGATVSTNINSAVSVALQSRIDIDVLPEAKDTFTYNSAKLTITTNSIDGYSVYLYTNEPSANLINPEDYNARIAPVEESGATPSDFTANTWGYNLSGDGSSITDSSIFRAVPLAGSSVAGTAIQETATTAKADIYNLSFGVNVAPDLPAGQYSSNVIVSVVVNPSQIRSLTQLTYMQDMTDVICKNTAPRDTDSAEVKYQYMEHPVEKQLIDIRDGRKYWVGKLADGNCWMTQNLALTLKDFEDGEGVRAMATNGAKGSLLTSSNTDVLYGWTAASSIPPQATTMGVPKAAGQNVANSWNLGEYVLATPTQTKACSDQTSADPLSKCALFGFVDVSEASKWSDNFQISAGDWNGQEQLVTVMPTDHNDLSQGGAYDAHYLVGNYYTYAATAAGSHQSSPSAPYSICPKGWQLPVLDNFDTSGSYSYLLRQYGLASSATVGAIIGQGVDGETYNIATNPLNYVRAGRVSSNLSTSGQNGYYRTSATYGDGYNTYLMKIAGTTISLKNTGESYGNQLGFSVRCLAK